MNVSIVCDSRCFSHLHSARLALVWFWASQTQCAFRHWSLVTGSSIRISDHHLILFASWLQDRGAKVVQCRCGRRGHVTSNSTTYCSYCFRSKPLLKNQYPYITCPLSWGNWERTHREDWAERLLGLESISEVAVGGLCMPLPTPMWLSHIWFNLGGRICQKVNDVFMCFHVLRLCQCFQNCKDFLLLVESMKKKALIGCVFVMQEVAP